MSWQAAVLVGVALVIAGGFAWYERSRPPARLVALVAALAALAVAGRLALAPVPNLVATTDVALFTGYALGGAPGFAVGALAAPISNIWLGQGPWTVWQMAGWGLVGLAGAGLALLTRRRLGRLGLAIACGVAGLAYGALLDLSVMVGYGGEQSLDRYLALSARGIPFNVVHALGNFAIGLAAGPAVVRMISRYRTRLVFTWKPAATAPLALLAVTLAGALLAPGPAAAGPAARPSAARAQSWLARAQNDDGGFGATLEYRSSPSITGWVMLGLESAGRNPLDLRRGGESPISYLRSQVGRLRSDGDLERTILALRGAGIDPRRFAGHDLVAELRSRRGRDGSVDGQVNLTAFYVLAMRAAGVDPDKLGRSLGWLRRAQGPNGGWGIEPRAPSDAESTGAALQALGAGSAGGGALDDGVRYLRRAQARNGGFAVGTTGIVNSQATAWALQGLIAARSRGAPIREALGYLDSVRAPDGHYRYSSSSDQTPVWVTAQVLLALERGPLPLEPAPRRARRSRPEHAGAGSRQSSAGLPAPTGRGEATAGAGGSGVSAGAGGGADAGAAATPATARGGGDPASNPAASGGPGAEPAGESGAGAAPIGVATTASMPAGEEDDSSSLYWAIAGATALAAAAAGGLAWYRRRDAGPPEHG